MNMSSVCHIQANARMNTDSFPVIALALMIKHTLLANVKDNIPSQQFPLDNFCMHP